MSNNIDNLKNSGMERSVISGVLWHGANLFIDISDILSTNDFSWKINQKLFNIFKYLVEEKETEEFDIPTILSAAKVLGYDEFTENKKYAQYLEALFDTSISRDNTLSIAVAVYKLSIARKGIKQIDEIKNDLYNIKGDEKLNDIISKIEDPIFSITGNMLLDNANSFKSLTQDFEQVMTKLSEDPKDIVGLPTGFPNWDTCIGGGLYPGSVNVVGARAKGAKSIFCINVAKNIAENNIPVLYLDTELTREMQIARLTSLISGIEINKIQTGQFSLNTEENNIIWSHQKKIENLPITHCSIAGQSIRSILSICRRWLSKYVGFNKNGHANPCLIIYDYMKLMDSSDIKGNMQEYQLLGFLITEFHNFALRWNLPILSTIQLNRDGIEKEDGSVISQSDRILWLCTSFTILKNKTSEDFSRDPHKNGVKKLIVSETRNGPGTDPGDYINIKADLARSTLKENKMYSQIIRFNKNEEIDGNKKNK